MARRFLVAGAIVVGVATFTQGAAPTDVSNQITLGLVAGVETESPEQGAGELRGEGIVLERGRAAVEALDFEWATVLPEWTIEFHPGRDDLFGLTHTQENRIEIFVRDDQSDLFLQHVIAHELGHAVDVTLNTTAEREQWQSARDINEHDWWPGSGATDFATGAGDFAEAFAVMLTGPDDYRSELGNTPTAEQLELLAELSQP